MSQAPHEIIDVPNGEKCTHTSHYSILAFLASSLPHPPKIGDDQYPPGPQLAQNQVLSGVSDFVDGSGPIFSMYLEMATEDDKKMVEDWKADADGILIFVRLESNPEVYINSVVIDGSILRCCCNLNLNVNSRHPTEPTGYRQLLPRKYLLRNHQPKRFQFPPCFPTPVLSTTVYSLGKRSLVLELGDQPHLCVTCDLPATMGSKIPQGHFVALQSRQESTDPCVLFRRCRETSPSVGSRNIAYTSPHFPLPVLRRPRCVSMERQSHVFHGGVVMGRDLLDSVRMDHIDANLPS